MKDIITGIGFPKQTEVGKTLFKKLFYEGADLSKQEKELLMNQIDKVVVTHNLHTQNINIRQYEDTIREYHAIQVIEVRVNAKDKVKKIAEMIIEAIPQPVILQVKYGQEYMLVLGLRIFDEKDKEKSKIEEWIYSKWIDIDNPTEKENTFLQEINIKNLSYSHFYRLYMDIADQVNRYNASLLTENYVEAIDSQEVKSLYRQVEACDTEIQRLRVKLKKESQFNKKVELNVQIKRQQQIREELIQALNGGTSK